MDSILLRNEGSGSVPVGMHGKDYQNHRHLNIQNQIKKSQYAFDRMVSKFERTKAGLRNASSNSTKYRLNLVNRIRGNQQPSIPFSQFRRLEQLKKKHKKFEKSLSTKDEEYLRSGISVLGKNKMYSSNFEEGYNDIKNIEEFDYLLQGKKKKISVKDEHSKRMNDYQDQLLELINTPRGSVKRAIDDIKTKREEAQDMEKRKELEEREKELEMEFNEHVNGIVKKCRGVPVAFTFLKHLHQFYLDQERVRRHLEMREENARYDRQLQEMGRFYLKNYTQMLRKLELNQKKVVFDNIERRNREKKGNLPRNNSSRIFL